MGSRRTRREEAAGASSDRRLGTFLGVFTPSILTILGVVLYLRTGWVVGHVGLLPTLAIVVLAHAITASTAFSASWPASASPATSKTPRKPSRAARWRPCWWAS